MEIKVKYRYSTRGFYYVIIDESEYESIKIANSETYKEKRNNKTKREYEVEISDDFFDFIFVSSDKDSPVYHVNFVELIDAFSSSLKLLTENQRKVIIYVHLLGLNLNKYSQLINKNYKTVYECYQSALKKLQILLKDFL